MVGSVKDTLVSSDMYIKLSNTTHLSELLLNNDLVVPMGQMSQHALQTLEILSLTEMYQTILPDYNVLHVSRLCYQFGRAKVGNKLLLSQVVRSDHSSYICGLTPPRMKSTSSFFFSSTSHWKSTTIICSDTPCLN